MIWYRLYQLEQQRIVSGEDFEAEDDRAALVYAHAHIGADAVEIWSGARKVGFIAGPAPAAAAMPISSFG